MKVKIHKWNDGVAIRIPKSLTADLNIREGSTVEVAFRRGRLVIAPASEVDYTLEGLLVGVTEHNLHAEIDAGEATYDE
jgi:antitoxin MazE